MGHESSSGSDEVSAGNLFQSVAYDAHAGSAGLWRQSLFTWSVNAAGLVNTASGRKSHCARNQLLAPPDLELVRTRPHEKPLACMEMRRFLRSMANCWESDSALHCEAMPSRSESCCPFSTNS